MGRQILKIYLEIFNSYLFMVWLSQMMLTFILHITRYRVETMFWWFHCSSYGCLVCEMMQPNKYLLNRKLCFWDGDAKNAVTSFAFYKQTCKHNCLLGWGSTHLCPALDWVSILYVSHLTPPSTVQVFLLSLW